MGEISPPREAISLIALDRSTKYLGSVGIKIVSIDGFRPYLP
jgi:hypothetical protein